MRTECLFFRWIITVIVYLSTYHTSNNMSQQQQITYLHNAAKRPPLQVSICFALSVFTDSHGLKEPYSLQISVHMRGASEFDQNAFLEEGSGWKGLRESAKCFQCHPQMSVPTLCCAKFATQHPKRCCLCLHCSPPINLAHLVNSLNWSIHKSTAPCRNTWNGNQTVRE